MNTTGTRPAAATFATAIAFAAALTIMSAIPTTASAERPDPSAGPDTQCVGSDPTVDTVDRADTAGAVDIGSDIAQRKAEIAQDYVDHAQQLHQLAAR